MFLKIIVPNDRLATAVIETAITCGKDPRSMEEMTLQNGEKAFVVIIGPMTSKQLNECRMNFVRAPYYDAKFIKIEIAKTLETQNESFE